MLHGVRCERKRKGKSGSACLVITAILLSFRTRGLCFTRSFRAQGVSRSPGLWPVYLYTVLMLQDWHQMEQHPPRPLRVLCLGKQHQFFWL